MFHIFDSFTLLELKGLTLVLLILPAVALAFAAFNSREFMKAQLHPTQIDCPLARPPLGTVRNLAVLVIVVLLALVVFFG